MALQSRRQFLRAGAVAGASSIAGCAFGFGSETECTTGRTVRNADATYPDTASWPTYQYDPGNTGYNPRATGPAGGDVGVAWRYSACTEAESGVVVRGSRACAGGLVVDGRAGRRVGGEWHGHMRTPTLAGGSLYVSAVDLEARDPSTGQVTWTFQTETDAGALPAPTVASETVYVPGGIDDPRVYAVRAADGSERWRYRTTADVRAPVAVSDGVVVVADESGTLAAVDAATGDERWARSLGHAAPSTAPVATDGRLYLGSEDGGVRVLTAAGGDVVWTQDAVAGGPVAVGDGSVFVAGKDAIAALDAADGAIQWRNGSLDVDPVPPAVTDDAVFIGDASDGDEPLLVALDRKTGDELWRVNTRTVLFGDYTRGGIVPGIAVVDDVVYATTAPGDLYAVTTTD